MKLDNVIATRDRKTVYRSENKSIKLFEAGYSKADILNEALNQSRIEETSLNIPHVLEVTTVDGRWAIVSEFIEGSPLSELMAENSEKKAEYIDLLVDIQLKVYKETCPLLNRLRDKLGRKLAESDFDATTRYALYNRIEALPRRNNICHGDLTPSNIIIAEDGTPFIIDWSHAALGNECADVARTYILLMLSDGTDTARLYLDVFCKKSSTDRQRILEWLPIVAAALSAEQPDTDPELIERLVNGKEC